MTNEEPDMREAANEDETVEGEPAVAVEQSRGDEPARESGGAEVRGLVARRLTWAPARVLAVITGFALLRGLVALAARFLLMFRRRARVLTAGGTIVIEEEWSLFGKVFRRTKTVAAVRDVAAVRFEDRRRYIHLLVGFGFLAVGVWLGVQWLVDGLRAGYPFLATVGAAVVLAGILLDVALYLWVPEGNGKSRLILSMGSWRVRVAGVDRIAAERLLEEVRGGWRSDSEAR